MKKVRHVLGLSGGKDSTALAIYLKERHPELEIEYYFCDTGKELDETYQLLENLEVFLGKKIARLNAVPDSPKAPFDHFLELYGGYLPSATARWCTRELKLKPFENWVADDPVVSYVGIRGDEHREAYISKKSNIQSIFPFRQNIWSEDVIGKVLANTALAKLAQLYESYTGSQAEHVAELVMRPLSPRFDQRAKLNALLDFDTKLLNKVVFGFLSSTDYPLANTEVFAILDNDEIIVREDVFRILEESGVGVPQYYQGIEYSSNGNKGVYNRSRSGCFFCFFQQKIEWVWLYEQHPDLFEKAAKYEKDGFSWTQNERLEDLVKPERIEGVKAEHLKRMYRNSQNTSNKLLDILEFDEEQGCAACFI